ncbi:ankyrin [Wilcoxina mikolae CBS 423.85]|nr:ankyrin [Wilcoxina mikolae CBS 423.85]
MHMPLHLATTNGRNSTVQLLLDRRADIEAKDTSHCTPLHRAASMGLEAKVRLLLDRGADIEAKNRDNFTPLHKAALRGHKATAQLLLDRGADIEAKHRDHDFTPLDFANSQNHWDVVNLLHERKTRYS